MEGATTHSRLRAAVSEFLLMPQWEGYMRDERPGNGTVKSHQLSARQRKLGYYLALEPEKKGPMKREDGQERGARGKRGAKEAVGTVESRRRLRLVITHRALRGM